MLEMILAMMITSMTVLGLYGFVSTHLESMHLSTEIGDERQTLNTVVKYLQDQMNTIAPGNDGFLKGQAFKFHGMSSDELTWRCPAGAGVLTTAAGGDFLVTLAVQPVGERSTETELGLRRRPAPANTLSYDLRQGGAGGRYDWLPLVRPMAGIEIRYYDAQGNTWSDDWKDETRRPTLLRVRLWRHADDAPLEAVVNVPASKVIPQQ